MKKNQYIAPELQTIKLNAELPMAQSNKMNSNSVNLNPNTMKDGDGGDAVKANAYDVWEDDWSE